MKGDIEKWLVYYLNRCKDYCFLFQFSKGIYLYTLNGTKLIPPPYQVEMIPRRRCIFVLLDGRVYIWNVTRITSLFTSYCVSKSWKQNKEKHRKITTKTMKRLCASCLILTCLFLYECSLSGYWNKGHII